MKILKAPLLAVAVGGLVLTSSCQKELTDLNRNPNNLEVADSSTLLSNIVVSEFKGNADIAWSLGNAYCQLATFSADYYNHSSRYQPVSNDPYWITNYTTARDAGTLATRAQAAGNGAVQGVALAMQAYAFAQLTELWGDIPFKQALSGEKGVFTAPYDSQQTVYTDPDTGILASLRKANDLLKANPQGIIAGDPLYGGSPAKWRKLVNGLRLRYLLRVSGKMDVKAEMQSIVADGALFQNASEAGVLPLQNTGIYVFTSVQERAGDFGVKYLNSLLYSSYVATGDQDRLPLIFAKNAASASQPGFSFSYYGGMPIVIEASTAQINQASLFSNTFRTAANSPLLYARVLNYSEVQFILAEAVLKGLISTGTAKAYYEQGVRGAYAEYGLADARATAYLLNPGTAYTPATALNQIITQKWMANLNNGFEGWIEYKRTGIPAFNTGGTANLNGGTIPNRFIYPDSEKTINAANYTTEIAKSGGKDDPNYRPWW